MSLKDDVDRLRQELHLGEGTIAATLKEACAQLGVKEEGTLPERAASCMKTLFGVLVPGNGSVEQPQAVVEERSANDGDIDLSGTKRSRPTAAVAVDQLSEKRSRSERDAPTDGGAPAAQALAPATLWAPTDPWDIQEEDDDLVPEISRESPASNLL